MAEVSNSKIYDRMDAVRLELKGDISTGLSTLTQNQGRLEKKFDDLEAGRLTAVETGLATLKARLSIEEESNIKWKNWIVPGIVYILGQGLLLILFKRMVG